MLERMIFAGSGGQGMMTIGKIVAGGGIEQGLNVTYFPSYGAEVRGGTAHCHVVLSDEHIYDPIVTHASSLIVMNQPSMDKFKQRLDVGGLLIVNSSLAEVHPEDNMRILSVNATALANDEIGNIRTANMIMVGAMLYINKILPVSVLMNQVEKKLSGKNASLIDINRKAIEMGMKIAQEAGVE